MIYNKDYLTGMKHIANAVIYELRRLRDYYKEKEEKESTSYGIEYYSIFGEGIDKAIDVVENTVYMQLMEKKDND